MSLRYHLLPFSIADVASDDLANAFALKLGAFASSPLAPVALTQWKSVLSHALAIGAQTILIQDAVRDPDFIEEYEAFYSKQQKRISKLCKRLHFFNLSAIAASPAAPATSPPNGTAIVQSDESVLDFIDAASTTNGAYLGFVTLRPLRHAPVGASILVDDAANPVLCKDQFPVHIAGREFVVHGTPYLQQDNAVGACAQASIWVALRTIRRRVGNSAYSPAELTVAATKHLTLNRVFPGRGGLNTFQMLEAIRSAGHDPLLIDLKDPSAGRADRVLEFATPYLESGLPVILALFNGQNGGGHAVVAIGHSNSAVGNPYPGQLTIHNDNTGCYLPLQPQPTQQGGYALEQCVALITPLPEGICLTAAEAEGLTKTAFALGLELLKSIPSAAALSASPLGLGDAPNIVLRVFLSTRHSFRKWASNCPDLDQPTKLKYRTFELPKFIWVAELHDASTYRLGEQANATRLGEFVFDASADALHGDALIFMRLSCLLLGSNASNDGLLFIEDVAHGSVKELLAIKAPRSTAQPHPWG